MYNTVGDKEFPDTFLCPEKEPAIRPSPRVRGYGFIHLCLDYPHCARTDVASENKIRWKKSKWDELHFISVGLAVYYSVSYSSLKYYFQC